MTPQEQADKVLRLITRLEMLSKTTIKSVQKQIKLLQREVAGLLVTGDMTTKKGLAEIRREIKKIHSLRYAEIDELIGEASAVSAEASLSMETAYFASLGVAADAAARIAISEKVIARSLERIMPGLTSGSQVSVGEMLERFKAGSISTLQNIAVRAQAEGMSIRAITALVADATNLQGRHAATVTRTLIQSSSNQARDDVAKTLGAEKEIWLATLDSKTCAYCAGLDGQCKPAGELPRPLAHPNCRCVLLYLPAGTSCKQMKGDLERPQRGEDGKSIIRPYQDYGSWIQTQPKSFQEETLGKERTKLLADDKITFKKMYTNTGRRKTVEDIKTHYL